jgi:hypothetical protein
MKSYAEARGGARLAVGENNSAQMTTALGCGTDAWLMLSVAASADTKGASETALSIQTQAAQSLLSVFDAWWAWSCVIPKERATIR